MPIHQTIIIRNLNNYLQWNNLPFRMNERGICNGLSSICAMHIVAGKKNEYYKLREKISKLDSESALDSEINHFVAQIIVSHDPAVLDPELTQLQSINTLDIDNEHLSSSFNLALVTSAHNWSEIVKDIDLQEGEAMLVGSANHRVNVSKSNGKYIIDDPNYAEGWKEFNTEKELVSELQAEVFKYDKQLSLLGMRIQVIRHPDKKNDNRNFPKVTDLYDKYLDSNNVNQTAIARGAVFDHFRFAIGFDDIEAVKKLIEIGIKDPDPIKSVYGAISCNSINVLNVLLEQVKEEDKDKLFDAIWVALSYGRKKAFDNILEHFDFKIQFLNLLSNEDKEKNAEKIICYAAMGGNVELIETVLDHCKAVQPIDSIIKTAIFNAIDSGSVESVKLLIDKLKPDSSNLDEKNWSEYLVCAIKNNQPRMVEYLMDEIINNDIHITISLSKAAIKGTDIGILRTLRDNAIDLSPEAKALIEKTPARQPGILLAMGRMLYAFTDFVKETIFNQQKIITINIAKQKILKEQMQTIVTDEPPVGQNNNLL